MAAGQGYFYLTDPIQEGRLGSQKCRTELTAFVQGGGGYVPGGGPPPGMGAGPMAGRMVPGGVGGGTDV